MKRLVLFLCMSVLCMGVLAATSDAVPLGDLGQVILIDRDSAAVLPTYYHHGEYWVAGRPGARYAIEVRNRSPGRLLAVTSVDGINVLSGETASWDQTGYVFDLNEAYQITGWRKSDAQVAAFTFTESPHSYAERTGRPANVGVIGVALFRERPPVKIESSAPPSPPPEPSPSIARRAEAPSEEVTVTGSRISGTAAPPAPGPLFRRSINTSDAAAPLEAGAARIDPKLGTGHGEREISYVTHTNFDRLHEQPDEIISIHYDSLSNLITMGIIPRPHAPIPAAEPFPGNRGYVPDPPPELP